MSGSVLRYAPAGDNLILVFTLPGEAQGVARSLDRLGWAEVVGTVAGDDTIFLAVPDRAAQTRVLRTLGRLVAAG